jgi:hypothetical protein
MQLRSEYLRFERTTKPNSLTMRRAVVPEMIGRDAFLNDIRGSVELDEITPILTHAWRWFPYSAVS